MLSLSILLRLPALQEGWHASSHRWTPLIDHSQFECGWRAVVSVCISIFSRAFFEFVRDGSVVVCIELKKVILTNARIFCSFFSSSLTKLFACFDCGKSKPILWYYRPLLGPRLRTTRREILSSGLWWLEFLFLVSGDDTSVGGDVCGGVEAWSRSGRRLTGETEKDPWWQRVNWIYWLDMARSISFWFPFIESCSPIR